MKNKNIDLNKESKDSGLTRETLAEGGKTLQSGKPHQRSGYIAGRPIKGTEERFCFLCEEFFEPTDEDLKRERELEQSQ